MKIKKETQIAIRLEPKEKKLLNYFATRLGITPSALVRNQIKVLLKELEDRMHDHYYASIADLSLVTQPKYSQKEIEEIFALKP